MASYRKVQSLSPTDTAYIAGFIDGEGTITLSRKHRGENRQLVISISNTEREILDYIKQVVGAGKITNKKIYHDNHTPSMTYAITNRQALDLLEQIFPYLRSYKSERSALVLEHYVRLTPRNGKYTRQQREERKNFIEEFFNLRPGN